MNPRKAFENAINNPRSAFEEALGKTGAFDNTPMGMSQAMDLLHDVEGLDPRKAANLVERELKQRDFWDRYAAMGVWDVVMSSKVQPYIDVFKYLEDDVRTAARKQIPGDQEDVNDIYNETVQRWLKTYKTGKPTGKIRHKFIPRGGHIGHIWYIYDVDADVHSGIVELRVEMMNQFSGETKQVEESIGMPEDFEDVRTDDYGVRGDKQQSIVVTGTTYEGDEWEVQVELSAETGEFTGRDWGRDWEKTSF